MGATLPLPLQTDTVTEVGKRLLLQSDRTIITVLEKTPYSIWDKEQNEEQKLEAVAEARTRVVTSVSENLKQIRQCPQLLAGAVAGRASSGFEGLKHFGRNQLKSVTRFDLVEYAIEVIDNAQQTARSRLEDANHRLAEAVLQVSTSVAVVQEYWRDCSAQQKQISSDLSEKLHTTIAHAKELGLSGVEYLSTLKASLSLDRLSHLPADSVRFLYDSPALFSHIFQAFQEGRIQHSEVPSVVAAVYALLGAIREVVFNKDKVAVIKATSDEVQGNSSAVAAGSQETRLVAVIKATSDEVQGNYSVAAGSQETLPSQVVEPDDEKHQVAPTTEETEQEQHNAIQSEEGEGDE